MGALLAGLDYQLLNAKPENVERESEIVAQSGRKGAVTIATNMAGRGTDIILGGNAEFMARSVLICSLQRSLFWTSTMVAAGKQPALHGQAAP